MVAAALPDPATLGERMTGRTCAGTWVTGIGKDGTPRSTYLYHVVDNEHTMREYGSQAVVWQTAINPVVALELLDEGAGRAPACSGPRLSRPTPFLERLAELGSPHGQVELPLLRIHRDLRRVALTGLRVAQADAPASRHGGGGGLSGIHFHAGLAQLAVDELVGGGGSHEGRQDELGGVWREAGDQVAFASPSLVVADLEDGA